MRIVTDAAADLTAAEARALDIERAPLFIQFPEGEVSSFDISADEFYLRLTDLYPKIPTTALPSHGIFEQLYRRVAEADPEILSIHISSGLSGTVGAAGTAAGHVAPDIRVRTWDTMTLAGGQRFQVLAAAVAARSGWMVEAIEERLAAIRDFTELVFALDTLEYLAKGGRIGRVQALAGMLLHVKPIIHVQHDDGKYSTVGKSRSLPRALTTIVDHLEHLYSSTPLWVTVEHGNIPAEEAVLTEQVQRRLNVERIDHLRVSPVLGVHTGPAITGVAAVPMELMQEFARDIPAIR